MGYADYMKQLFPDSHNVEGEVYNVILGAIGVVFDLLDPIANNLAHEFTITAASGSALDTVGADWEAPRKLGENDTTYKARLLSLLPFFILGATAAGVKGVVKPFTGSNPLIDEWGQDAFSIGYSAIGDGYPLDAFGLFTFVLTVVNPGAVSYNHLDLETAVCRAKASRSTAIILHNGTDTSTAYEAADAKVNIV